MKVWTLTVNGDLRGIFDSEVKAVEARLRYLSSGPEDPGFAVLSIGQWSVQ
jgi:hypothetical protein